MQLNSASPRVPMTMRSVRGASLIELMVAITISLIIVAAMAWVFVGNSRTRAETERENQQIENGTYAVQALSFDLQMAGYWAEFNSSVTTLTTPAALPDPCATALATLSAAIPLSVQGYDNGTVLSCLPTDVAAGSDILVVRRVSGCVAGSANCAAIPTAAGGKIFFQASLCNNSTELDSGNVADQFRLSSNPTALNRHKKDCTTVAEMHELITRIYFVASNDRAGDGIPTLKRAEFNPLAAGGSWDIVSIAQGVQQMQVEYGIDIDGDRVPDVFKADPSGYVPASVPPPCTANSAACNFRNTTAVSVHLLVRNPTPTVGYTDTKTYSVGFDSGGAVQTVGAFGDNYRRHVYNSTVRLVNPSIR